MPRVLLLPQPIHSHRGPARGTSWPLRCTFRRCFDSRAIEPDSFRSRGAHRLPATRLTGTSGACVAFQGVLFRGHYRTRPLDSTRQRPASPRANTRDTSAAQRGRARGTTEPAPPRSSTYHLWGPSRHRDDRSGHSIAPITGRLPTRATYETVSNSGEIVFRINEAKHYKF